jgi:hypothetical protein
MLIFRFGLPSALTHNFAGLAATWAGAELLVKLGSGIRLKPFFTTETFLETMLVLHPQCSPGLIPCREKSFLRVIPKSKSLSSVGGSTVEQSGNED